MAWGVVSSWPSSGKLTTIHSDSSGAVKAGLIGIPGVWTRPVPGAPNHHRLLGGQLNYEARVPLSSDNDLFLKASQGAGTLESENSFEIDLNKATVVRPIPATQWESARALARHSQAIFVNDSHEPNGNHVSYAGKVFLSSAPVLRSASLSPDGRWLAILGETVKEEISIRSMSRSLLRRLFRMPFLGGDGKSLFEGDYSLDVFDVPSGQRVALVKAHYVRGHEVSTTLGYDGASWFDNMYFVAPLDFQRRFLFVAAIAPQRER